LRRCYSEHNENFSQAALDGTVQQRAIHTIGGVVAPAQVLIVLVPAASRIEIEAMIANKDIGFVEEGHDVEIKIDTFNFTKYGLLHGKILTVSADSITREKPQGQQNRRAIHDHRLRRALALVALLGVIAASVLLPARFGAIA